MIDDLPEPCPKGGEHRIKFNGGDPLCIKCGTHVYPDGGRLVVPVTLVEPEKKEPT